MPKVTLVTFKDGERKDFPLTAASTTVGRRPDCGLRVATGDVSRQHCEVTVGSSVWVKDLGSSNGTFVNGKRIAESKLNAGDVLGVGPILFVVQVDGKPEKVEEPVRPAAPAAPAAGAATGSASTAKKSGPPQEIDEDDLFEMSDDDLDMNDPLSALDMLDDDDDDLPQKKKKK
ncbi:MAG: FHA domain-containing protein [Phycisphaerales bacterium]|nr:FHA domain-containing protein [Phycisphaerales bacterium]